MSSQNSLDNQVVNNNFTVTHTNPGGDAFVSIENLSNTAASNATLHAITGGTSGGDAQTQYAITGGTTWTQGIDNSDTDAYVVAISATLGTTNAFHITSAGAPTFPIAPLD